MHITKVDIDNTLLVSGKDTLVSGKCTKFSKKHLERKEWEKLIPFKIKTDIKMIQRKKKNSTSFKDTAVSNEELNCILLDLYK